MQKIGKVSDIESGKGIVVGINGRQIAVFSSGGKFYAIDNRCPHRGGPLGEGYLDGEEVTCPWHAWTFNVKTGECGTNPGMKQKTFPVTVEGDDIYLQTSS